MSIIIENFFDDNTHMFALAKQKAIIGYICLPVFE